MPAATTMLESLALPRGTILTLAHWTGRGGRLPLLLWGELLLAAAAGAIAHLGGVAMADHILDGTGAAVSTALRRIGATGLASVVFVPLLALALRHPLRLVLHACLSSLARGAIPLLIGAAIIPAAALAGIGNLPVAAAGFGVLLVADLVIGACLVEQLEALGTRRRTAWVLWIVGFHGLAASLLAAWPPA